MNVGLITLKTWSGKKKFQAFSMDFSSDFPHKTLFKKIHNFLTCIVFNYLVHSDYKFG
jgi:hypothetical protein